MAFQTEQEDFWAGEFGDTYIARNQSKELLAANICFFSKILNKVSQVKSVIEFGSNIGLNLIAIQSLLPHCEVSAIEINTKAVEILKEQKIKTYAESMLEFKPDYKRDLVLISGVLIHINPDKLSLVYENMYNSSQKYILIAEYYNPTPVSVEYRGYKNKLFKRDFAGEMLDKFTDLKLIDYGFSYHRDNNFKFDDLNWFLLEKSN